MTSRAKRPHLRLLQPDRRPAPGPGHRCPAGPTLAEGPHYLSDDGNRFFFESFDRLLPADESLKRDVYEFERPGSGSCDAANPNFVSSAGGCHFLLSGGQERR